MSGQELHGTEKGSVNDLNVDLQFQNPAFFLFCHATPHSSYTLLSIRRDIYFYHYFLMILCIFSFIMCSFYTSISLLLLFFIYLKCHHCDFFSKSLWTYCPTIPNIVLNICPDPTNVFLLVGLLVNWFLYYHYSCLAL